MLAVMHAVEDLLESFGRHEQSHQTFREAQPSDQSDDHRQRAAFPDIVPEYHREPHREADYGVDEHDRPIDNRGLDNRASAHQQGDHEQDDGHADQPREENGKSGHSNLRYVE
jgi:hypothetical protein